jgi:pyruvate/2-oxoglutarate dehydrogenase complex dihydrolipoamide acyltransferase (E2) component
MTLRGAEKGGDRGNQVGFTLMPVYSEIADPLERLSAISASAQTSKRVSDAVGKELARDLLEHLPAPLSQALIRNLKLPGIGLIVSNVRGPDVPLYMAGARLVNYSPISIAIDGVGLNVTGFSYAGTMWICAVSCRDMLPDPAFFADCLRGSFAQLRDAAAARAAEAAEEAAAPKAVGPRRRLAKAPAPQASEAVAAPVPRRARRAKPALPASGRPRARRKAAAPPRS